jgi:RNA polymerase-binding transcription factor DksA
VEQTFGPETILEAPAILATPSASEAPATLEGSATFDRDRDLAILTQIETELADVEAALERLENGSYGTCEVCARPIEDSRLEAAPATRVCLTHA